MSAVHLSPEELGALLEGGLSDARETALRAHLETGCETCGAALDEAMGAELLEDLSSVGQGPTDIERARARRAVVASVKAPAGKVWALVAAAVLALGFAWTLTIPESSDPRFTVKGESESRSIPVELSFLVGPEGSVEPEHMDRGASNRRYQSDAQLVFRMLSFEALHTQLLHVHAGEVEILESGGLREAGRRYLEQGGQIAAYRLDGLRGDHDFILLGSPVALPAELAEVIEESLAGPERGHVGEVAYHRVRVHVTGDAP